VLRAAVGLMVTSGQVSPSTASAKKTQVIAMTGPIVSFPVKGRPDWKDAEVILKSEAPLTRLPQRNCQLSTASVEYFSVRDS